MMYMNKLICRLQRKVITKVTSLPNHSTGRKSNEPIRSRENASSCTCCFMYLKCFYRKEGRSHGWEDNRRTLFTIYINRLTVLKLRRQHTKAPLAGAIGPFFMSLLYPPNAWCKWCVKLGHTTGVYVPYSFRTVVWVLLPPTTAGKCKCCEAGPMVFRPYPRRLESLTVSSCHDVIFTFYSVWWQLRLFKFYVNFVIQLL